jgi:hypothetical protein
MQSLLLFAIFILVGYYLSTYISKPVHKNGEKLPNRLPLVRFRNIEILPCVRIHFRNKTYWFHHWFYLSVITVGAFLIYDNIIHYTSAKVAAGAAMGGIIQGLRYPDRFKFRHPRQKN